MYLDKLRLDGRSAFVTGGAQVTIVDLAAAALDPHAKRWPRAAIRSRRCCSTSPTPSRSLAAAILREDAELAATEMSHHFVATIGDLSSGARRAAPGLERFTSERLNAASAPANCPDRHHRRLTPDHGPEATAVKPIAR